MVEEPRRISTHSGGFGIESPDGRVMGRGWRVKFLGSLGKLGRPDSAGVLSSQEEPCYVAQNPGSLKSAGRCYCSLTQREREWDLALSQVGEGVEFGALPDGRGSGVWRHLSEGERIVA